MIDDAIRHAVFSILFPGERLAIVTTRPDPYRLFVAARPNAALIDLGAALAAPLACATAIVEGIEDIDDPVAALRDIAAHAGAGTRIMVLAGNPLFAPALEAFVGGGALARCHAFVEAELIPLLAAAGLPGASVTPIRGGALANTALPLDVTLGTFKLRIDTPEAMDRLQIAAYLVTATIA